MVEGVSGCVGALRYQLVTTQSDAVISGKPVCMVPVRPAADVRSACGGSAAGGYEVALRFGLRVPFQPFRLRRRW